MALTSIAFAAFLAVVVPLYHLCPQRYRAHLLLAASYLFYATWSVPCAVVLLLTTVVTFVLARRIDASSDSAARGRLVWAAVLLLLLSLVLFKSVHGFADLVQQVFLDVARPGELLRLNIVMPLGISYYTFKLISYVVDVYWGKMGASTRFVPFAAYAAFFPQITAGPIQRAESFLPQVEHPAALSPALVTSGLRRILLGCFKKLVVADNLAIYVNYVFVEPQGLAGAPLLLGTYLFALQLYADFSGLTDIAIGTGRLLGIQSPENFDAPFSASNISDFWRRWHMTLTGWLTDYVFTPLRMATRRAGDYGLAFSLTVNMLLIGIWHGLSWTYVLFGAVHAVALVVYALTLRARSRFFRAHAALQPAARVAGVIGTFHLVAASLVLFRANSLADAFYILSHLFQTSVQSLVELPGFLSAAGTRGSVVLGLTGYFLVHTIELLRRHDAAHRVLVKTPRWGRWVLYYAAILAVLSFRPAAQQFIYFKF